MGPAEAFAVGWIVQGTTVTDLDLVVGEHTVARLGLPASLPVVDSLAAPACSGNHGLAPGAVFGSMVDGIGDLRCNRCAATIESRDAPVE